MAKGKGGKSCDGRGVKDRGISKGTAAGSKNASGAPGFKTVKKH